jgi:hypothetical protein
MKRDKNIHNLGNEWRPTCQYWYYLIVQDSGDWSIVREVDYDSPGKDAQELPLPKEEIKNHSIDGKPLADVIESKLKELGLISN